jgi:hypothetical protein
MPSPGTSRRTGRIGSLSDYADNRPRTGQIGTIAALVLGSLISSANNSYDTESGQVKRITADVILLDRLLGQYGPETPASRDLLWRAIGPMVERIWGENSSHSTDQAPFVAGVGEDVFAQILALSPKNDAQRALKERAVTVSSALAQTRLLLFVTAESERESGAPRDEFADRLTETRAVIEEAMRLYPPIIGLSRTAIRPDELAGRSIERGTMVVMSPWALNRHRLLWDNPDLFGPSRFLRGAQRTIERYAYLPFGVGPRMCIGAAFAL